MCPVKGETVIVVSSVWRVHCGVSVTHTCTQNIGFISSYCDRLQTPLFCRSVTLLQGECWTSKLENWKPAIYLVSCFVLFFYSVQLYGTVPKKRMLESSRVSKNGYDSCPIHQMYFVSTMKSMSENIFKIPPYEWNKYHIKS